MKYTCNGFQSVNAETINAAAEVFANRQARRTYGRSGYSRTCTMGAYSQDGWVAEFSAFIGVTTGRNETTGHNVNFRVFRATEAGR